MGQNQFAPETFVQKRCGHGQCHLHKRKDIQDIIKSVGHTLEYLPVYSPDLNPIENKWAHIKSLRRKLMCSISQLFKIESFYMT